ncbi:MAG: T9SS type A sorting domain-containing protein [Bacteroidetes bacterium]|nr:T9SS type A sorting domain-containing protein [Bacteroidota bacterium]
MRIGLYLRVRPIIIKPITGLIFIFQLLSIVHAQAQCTMACGGQINLSLDATCEVEITPAYILQSQSNCNPPEFVVTVYQPNGVNPIPTSPIVTALQIGQILPVKVTHVGSGSSCFGSVMVSDNLAPVLTCPPNVTVSCTEDLHPMNLGAPQVVECQAYTLNYFDMYTDQGCSDPTGYYTRTWNASDISGNFSTCQQIITISEPLLDDVVFPTDLDGVDAPALACPNPNTAPSATGVPTLDGGPIPVSGPCGMTVFYTDLEIPGCEGSTAYLRTWSVLADCSGQLIQHTQVILVDDNLAPNVQLTDTLNVSVNQPGQCLANVNLPAAVIDDNCASNLEVQILSPFGTIMGNGGTLTNVALGVHNVTYQVSDPCGNITNKVLILNVFDGMSPVAICDQVTSVSLGPFGTTMVFATTFDDGSFDNCCAVNLSARRQDMGCGSTGVYGNSVTFCCEDIGQVVSVQMRAMDCNGNSNFCNVNVFVNDQISPEIVCPAPVTISCSAVPADTTETGTPYVFDGCGIDNVWYNDTQNLDECNEGTITRIWNVVDDLGNTSSCSQIITVEDMTPLIVNFPPNLDLYGCYMVADLHPDELDAPYNMPQTLNDNCEQTGISFSDEVFTSNPMACLLIKRTWTVLDFCVYETNSGSTDGLYTAVQTIRVFDNEAPTITCPPTQTVNVTNPSCTATVNVPASPLVDDCNPNYSVAVQTPWGMGTGPFSNVPVSNYTITYLVTDPCGNTGSCNMQLELIDMAAPVANCLAGAVVNLQPVDTSGNGQPDYGTLDIYAWDYNQGSADGCDPELGFSFSADPYNIMMTIDCGDVGVLPIQIWVTDDGQNQDSCSTTITVTDTDFSCNGGVLPMLGGIVENETGQAVALTEVMLDDTGQSTYMTEEDGLYLFDQVEQGVDYMVTPEKDIDLRNGMTTWDLSFIQKHVLGIEPLGSPYKIIAADADMSGTVTTIDILYFQKIILFLEDKLPNNNTSWRFVDASYEFINPLDPLDEAFPEFIYVSEMSDEILNANFMAIKVGDVNNSADPMGIDGVDQREALAVFPLKANDVFCQAGEIVEWAIFPERGESLQGMQGSMQLDLAAIDLIDVQSSLPAWSANNWAMPTAYPGLLTWAWTTGEPMVQQPEAPILKLRFRCMQDGYLQEFIQLDHQLLPEVYTEASERMSLEINWQESKVESELFRVYPNPLTEHAEVCWPAEYQPEWLEVWDVNGRIVKQIPVPASANCISLKRSDFAGAGLYMVSIRGRLGTSVKKVMVGE